MKKKTVNHLGMEFGYEMIAALPYAYYLYKNDKLKRTVSNEDMRCFYYFSADHRETLKERSWKHYKKALRRNKIPNLHIHQPDLDWRQWLAPPLKTAYKNDMFDYDVVVINKYFDEWWGYPMNFIPPVILDKIFTKLKGKKILYFRLTEELGHGDTLRAKELNEWRIVKKHGVDTIQDVMKDNLFTLNHLQCLIYANCDKFITVQGGGSILASYFAKENIIYAIAGGELNSNSFRWYERFNGAKIKVAINYDMLCDMI